MDDEKQARIVEKIIRGLVSSNIQNDYEGCSLFIDFGRHRIRYYGTLDASMKELTDYFLSEIKKIVEDEFME